MSNVILYNDVKNSIVILYNDVKNSIVILHNDVKNSIFIKSGMLFEFMKLKDKYNLAAAYNTQNILISLLSYW